MAHAEEWPSDAVLQRLGVVIEAPLAGASSNEYWQGRRGAERVVLRRVSPRSLAGLAHELDVLRALDERGWPVPRALEGPVEIADQAWVLSKWLPGTPPAAEDEAAQRERGRLLARLHGDLDDLVAFGQRDRWQLADEVVMDPALHKALTAYERLCPQDGHLLRWHAERARELFADLDLTHARRTVLHSDLAPWNLLFEDGRLTGIVDFDATHLNYAVADFACSWRGRYDAVIAGYDDVRPLSDLDRQLITPVFWAWLFIGVAENIEQIVTGTAPRTRLEWPISKLPLRTPAMGDAATPYRSPF